MPPAPVHPQPPPAQHVAAYQNPAPQAGWAGQPVPPAPATDPVGGVGPSDPNALGSAVGRLGNSPRKQARVALAVAGAVLQPDEIVEAVVAGKFEDNAAVLVLTGHNLLLVDDRAWRPLVERFTISPALQVQGWQDDRTASLTVLAEGRQFVVERIADRAMAVEMAQRIRHRTGG